MEPGWVVEFLDNRNFLTALVTRVKGSKILVLSENDREMAVSQGRILSRNHSSLNPSHPRNELVKKLADISKHRQNLADQLDIKELWELLDGEGDEFPFDDLAELAWDGPADDDRRAAIYRAIFSDGLYFKMRPEFALRHSPERVEQIEAERLREAERERELKDGGDWLKCVWSDDYAEPPDCQDHVKDILRDMAIQGNDASEYKWGRKLLEQAGLAGDTLNPFNLLVKMGEMHPHENLDVIRLGLSIEFPEAVLTQTDSLCKQDISDTDIRRDLTDLDVITADSGGAKDFDDAVSIQDMDDRIVLGIHIADVAGLIEPDTPLDIEARQRTTSLYMPDRRVPMLPEILSEECLSLKADEVRPAFSLMIQLTPEGEVIDYEFAPSLIKVKHQLSYQEVDAGVETNLTLKRMFQLSRKLKERRLEAGALVLPLPKLNVFITPEGEIGVNLTIWENPGRSMIGEFMILANHLAADFLMKKEAPCLYRSQNPPGQRLIDGDTNCADLLPCLQQRRYLNRVSWGLEPLRHSGMGLETYSNLTSPLRRYIDLIIQRQVRSVVTTGQPLYDADSMGALLTEVETVLRKATLVMNIRRRYWLQMYLNGAGRKDYEALVLDRTPHRYRIYLPELALDADLPVVRGREFSSGDKVMVKVHKARPREDILKFTLA
jgi:exoribonuclease-2